MREIWNIATDSEGNELVQYREVPEVIEEPHYKAPPLIDPERFDLDWERMDRASEADLRRLERT